MSYFQKLRIKKACNKRQVSFKNIKLPIYYIKNKKGEDKLLHKKRLIKIMSKRKTLKKEKKRATIKNKKILFWTIITLLALTILYFNTQEFTLKQNIQAQEPQDYQEAKGILEEYIEISETEMAVIKTTSPQITIGQPVKWKKQIIPKSTGELEFDIPQEAQNINITKIPSETQTPGMTGEVIRTGDINSISYLITKTFQELFQPA